MYDKVKRKGKNLRICVSAALLTLCMMFTPGISAKGAQDIFAKSETGLKSVYDNIYKIAPKLVGVLGAIALLAWIFWPSSKGAEKGKTWFFRILGGVIGLVCLGLLIATIIKYFGTGTSPLDQDFTKAGS